MSRSYATTNPYDILNEDDEANDGVLNSLVYNPTRLKTKKPKHSAKPSSSAKKLFSKEKAIEMSEHLLANDDSEEFSEEKSSPVITVPIVVTPPGGVAAPSWHPMRIPERFRRQAVPVVLERKLSEFERRLNRDIRLAVDPFGFFEHGVLGTALFSSICAGATEFHFGQLVMALILDIDLDEQPLSLGGQIASGIVAIPASLVQMAFSSGTAVNFDIRLLRTLKNIFSERWRTGHWGEFKRHYPRALQMSLWDIAPSALGSVVMGYETFKRFLTTHPVLFFAMAAGRFKAAFNTNGIYIDSDNKRNLINHVLKKTYNNYAVISLIKDVAKKLKILMRNHPSAFIEAVNLGFLDSVHHTKKPSTYEHKVKQLLRMHDYFLQLQKLKPHIFDEKNPHWAVPISAEVLGTSTCLVNIMAATKAPELFGLPFAKNLMTFIELWIKTGFIAFIVEQPFLFGGFLAALILAGRPSGKSNRLINRDAVEQLINNILGAWDEGFYTSYKDKSPTEKTVFITICSLSIFYAFTKMGSALGYPVLPQPYVKIPEACFLTVVFGGLAYMSGNSFQTNSVNRIKRPLLEKFMSKSPADRIDYFYSLENPDRLKLVDLIYIYLANPNNGTFDAMLFTLATSPQAESDADLSDQTREELIRRFPNPIQREQQERRERREEREAKERDDREPQPSAPDDVVVTLETPRPVEVETKTAKQPPLPMLEALHRQHMDRQFRSSGTLPPLLDHRHQVQRRAPRDVSADEPLINVAPSLHFGGAPTRSSQTKKKVIKELNSIANSRTTSPTFKFSSRAQPVRLDEIPTLDLAAPNAHVVDLNITPPEIRPTSSSSSKKK